MKGVALALFAFKRGRGFPEVKLPPSAKAAVVNFF